MAGSRPATSMARHYEEEEDDDTPAQGRRKGMLPLTIFPHSIHSNQRYSTLPMKKSRGHQSTHAPKTHSSVNSIRDVSVSTAMSGLTIAEEPRKAKSKEHQAISKEMRPPSTPGSCHQASISTGLRNFRIDSTESALVLFQSPGDTSVAPKTPSQIPVPSKSEAMITTPATPCRTPKTSPSKHYFLSKTSNITGFTAWDVDGRVQHMETIFGKVLEHFSGTNSERDHLEDAVSLYKSRSKPISR
jgi:kinesin family protein C1